MATIAAVRTAVIAGLRAAALPATTHASPPASIQTPAVIVVPGDPYFDPDSIGDAVRGQVTLRVTTFVSRGDPESELAELEELALDAMLALPVGHTIGPLSRPSRVPIDDQGTRYALAAYFDTTARTNPHA